MALLEEHYYVASSTIDDLFAHYDVLISKKDSWIDTRIFQDIIIDKNINDRKIVDISAKKRVEKFFSFALPKVRELAIYCSVLPLNQEIIREVIRVKELGDEKDIFSEFYFGGLLDIKSQADIGDYKFYDDVAKVLREYISLEDAKILFAVVSDVISNVLIIASLQIGTVVLSVAGLSFLGLGPAIGTADWGQMIAFSRSWVTGIAGQPFIYWYVLFWPGLIIVLFALSWNLLGDAIRDVLDVRSH